MANIILPHNFVPRPYQKEALNAFDTYQRVVLIWHRRSGKDKTAFQAFIKKAMKRVGAYYYIFPEYEQGRKAFWDNIDNDWLTMFDHTPKEILKNKNDQSMQLEFVNGSFIQVIGTDRKIDNIVWTNPIWILFSEYPIADPRGWDLLRPIIKLNGGFAWFVFTPRGKNHGWKMREVARKNPETWYLSELWADKTFDIDGNRIVPDYMIEEERKDWMDEDLIQQEYFISFEASVKGAYYADQIRDARKEWRIGKVPYESTLDVYTVWDLWINDTTAIWFFQLLGKEARLVDHYETSGESLDHYVGVLQSKGYKYAKHFLPHDVEVKELQTGNTRKQFLESRWMNNIEVVEKLWVEEWIDMARRIFKNVWIDEDKCERWVNALSSYHKEFDAKNQTYRNSPKHDWSSNSADAFRYFAVTYSKMTKEQTKFDSSLFQTQKPRNIFSDIWM
jgi:phage terminase large subunit